MTSHNFQRRGKKAIWPLFYALWSKIWDGNGGWGRWIGNLPASIIRHTHFIMIQRSENTIKYPIFTIYHIKIYSNGFSSHWLRSVFLLLCSATLSSSLLLLLLLFRYSQSQYCLMKWKIIQRILAMNVLWRKQNELNDIVREIFQWLKIYASQHRLCYYPIRQSNNDSNGILLTIEWATSKSVSAYTQITRIVYRHLCYVVKHRRHVWRGGGARWRIRNP